MTYPVPPSETRNLDELRCHYELEKGLAAQLKQASREARRQLYAQLYDELYRQVPHLAQHSRDTIPGYLAFQLRALKRYLTPDTVFLELGAGNLALSFAVAAQTKRVYAVDVSDEFTRSLHRSPSHNMRLVLSDGTSIPVPAQTVTLAYSNQLMEHLHPDDAQDQLRNIFAALAPGGRYVCFTPHRSNGPHDISRYFDDVATGFHLKEYTNRELANLFRSVGFRQIQTFIGLRGWHLVCPLWISTLTETLIGIVPAPIRAKVAYTLPLRAFLGIRLVATK